MKGIILAGGALVVNRPDWVERANFLQEKGTDRSLVLFGQKTKYHWVDVGSSYLLSDILAAVLLSQLESEDTILALRSRITAAYSGLFQPYQDQGLLHFTPYNEHKTVNSHAFWVVFDTEKNKEEFILRLKARDVFAYIGYMPLHSSPMGVRLGNRPGSLPVTEDLAARVVRLPLYADLANAGLNHCLENMRAVLAELYGA